MKINLEIDCTPEELRQSFVLPDLQPMQEAVLGAMQKQMLDAVARSTPEALMRTWMPMFPQSSEQMQQMMGAFFRGLSPSSRSAADPAGGGGGPKKG